ncbi:hypothetical protein DV096_19850 [Bradymonadaceae bacterium TMQ3]|nr:hypothetical protein DV096_19850 [Bradymonadaceae bacterium TMQ3]TXC67891.1 hypothetical protein FRC91_19625 [Bradymonadales bacterium TMQ1]
MGLSGRRGRRALRHMGLSGRRGRRALRHMGLSGRRGRRVLRRGGSTLVVLVERFGEGVQLGWCSSSASVRRFYHEHEAPKHPPAFCALPGFVTLNLASISVTFCS